MLIIVSSFSLVEAEKFGYGRTEVTPINYSAIDTNNSQYLQGYTPTTLKDWIETAFDSIYCELTGCTMSGDLIVNADITADNFFGAWNGSSDYVPYTGATGNVDLGAHDLTTTGTGRFDGGLLDSSYGISVDLVNRVLTEAGTTSHVIDWGNRWMYDGSSDYSIDWGNRLLYANDGYGIILDWSTVGLADFKDSDITTTGDTIIDSDTSGLILGDAQDKKIFTNGSGMYFETLVGDTPYNFDSDITADNFLGAWNGSSDYVPYTGATGNVDLGAHDLTTTGNTTANSFRADAHEQTISANTDTITQTGQTSVALTLSDFQGLSIGETNPVFSDGTQIGQVMVVKVVDYGSFDIAQLLIKNNEETGKVNLRGDMRFSTGDTKLSLIVMWDGSLWVEVSRVLGLDNEFSGDGAGWGNGNEFSGDGAGWGSSNTYSGTASGGGAGNDYSGILSGKGQGNILNSYQAVFGRYSTDQGSVNSWVATDDLFKIGIGTVTGARADAFRLLKNGESHWETDSKHYYGLGNDVSQQFDGSDWIFNSENITANDEVHFTNFDKYTFDNEIVTTDRISSGQSTFSTTGPTDNVDVSGVNSLLVDCSSNAVTIGGFAGGVAGQILHIVLIDSTNHLILENEEGGGSQDLIMHQGIDEEIDAGGATMVCDGSDWYDCSHAKHV